MLDLTWLYGFWSIVVGPLMRGNADVYMCAHNVCFSGMDLLLTKAYTKQQGRDEDQGNMQVNKRQLWMSWSWVGQT